MVSVAVAALAAYASVWLVYRSLWGATAVEAAAEAIDERRAAHPAGRHWVLSSLAYRIHCTLCSSPEWVGGWWVAHRWGPAWLAATGELVAAYGIVLVLWHVTAQDAE